MKPRIAITFGDPAGIGPEIVAKALKDPRVKRACTPVVVGTRLSVPMGRPSRQAGVAAIKGLYEGLALVQGGFVKALVTAPVSKESFHLADYGFPGHTEWLAKRTGARSIAMLMAAGPLRTLLMTRHVPISQVSRYLTIQTIQAAARLGHSFIRGHVRSRPRLVLCGLNPHAGDHGLIGKEEQRVFEPAIRALKKEGISVAGPFASDIVFPDMLKGRYDLALAAYHDQGMIPLKMVGRERMVNLTLGLPFIRTSPAHGTAYDIAGKGKADARPMIEAILLAAKYS